MKLMENIEMPTLPVLRLEDELSIPLDLKEWVTAAQLRDWIVTDVEKLNWNSPELLEALRRHPDYEPKALIQTMTYALVTGIFGAEEIARHCSVNPEFRAIRPKYPPQTRDFQRFRRENRGLLKWSIAQLLSRALKSQFLEEWQMDSLPSGLRRYVIENTVERLDLARHMDRAGELS